MTINHTLITAGKFQRMLGIVSIVFGIFFSLSASQSDPRGNFYERGVELKNQGQYEAALGIWSNAKDTLAEPSYKIGRAYIELVADQQMKEYYKQASEMYMWGLTSTNVDSSKEVLIKDIEISNSLFSFKRYKELKDKAEASDPSVYEDLYKFWKRNDPTPLTPYNERLLEHWERVVYAWEHFKRPNRDEMDDRGELYIRYGEPDFTRTGQLNFNSGTVNFLLDQRMSGRLDPFEGDDAFYREAMKTMQFNLENRIRTLHQYPNYKIWIYENLDDKPDHAVFIFGSSGGVVYKRKNSVEDFIPSEAFKKEKITQQSLFMQQQTMLADDQNQRGGEQARIPDVQITPALIMQLMYYRQFSALDPYFAEAFDKMNQRYRDVTTRIPSSLARQFENTNAGELLRLQSLPPRQMSSHQREKSTLPVEFYTYRFIDESNQPYYKVFVKSDVADAGYFDYLKKNNSLSNDLWNNYSLRVGTQLLDNDRQVMNESQNYVSLNARNAEQVQSSFDLVQSGGGEQIRAAVALYDSTADSLQIAEDDVFEAGLTAMGEASNDAPEPLQLQGLEMGDIILGYGSTIGHTTDTIPFRIAHERVIPEGKSLKLYYEIYHLARNSDGISRFTFEYEISAITKTLFIPKKEKSDLSITINNETDQSRFTNSLEIQTANLEPGKYELHITVRDLVKGEEIDRNIEFEIQ